MAINPETNRIVKCEVPDEAQAMYLKNLEGARSDIVNINGSPIPKHWTVLKEGELIVVKDYTFRVAYMNDAGVLLEPASPADSLKASQ